MKKKLMIILPVLLLVLGGAYKMKFAKAGEAEAKPKVDGTVYILQKEFLVNLHDGRFAKLTAALLLAHDDTSAEPAGEEGASPPEGYGAMTQEAVVRSIITDDLTDAKASEVIGREGRERLQDEILKDLKKMTDVKVEEVLFPDVTVQ